MIYRLFAEIWMFELFTSEINDLGFVGFELLSLNRPL